MDNWELNETNIAWKEVLDKLLTRPHYIASPRGMEVREVIGGQYTAKMPAYIDLRARHVNVAFMFAEAAWIISGSNRLDKITPYMKVYSSFSDDGVFLRGAYGPKVVDQLGYVVDTIAQDYDTRQAVLTTWRERPGISKDIPCTISMQFILRGDKLHLSVYMRSHDAVKGFTYDVFTFSMVANAVRLLLSKRGINCSLGNITVTCGSLHLYSTEYEKAEAWLEADDVNPQIRDAVDWVMQAKSYPELVQNLEAEAERWKK